MAHVFQFFFKNMGCYSGVKGKLHTDEYLIYVFTGKVENGTPIIFNKTLYHFWFKQFRNNFRQ